MLRITTTILGLAFLAMGILGITGLVPMFTSDFIYINIAEIVLGALGFGVALYAQRSGENSRNKREIFQQKKEISQLKRDNDQQKNESYNKQQYDNNIQKKENEQQKKVNDQQRKENDQQIKKSI